MTTDLREEFQRLSEKATQSLKEVPESGSYRHVCSIWIRPSFSPSSRWTLYSPLPFAKGKMPFASRTIWRSDLDLEKFRSPVDRLRYPKDLIPTFQNEVSWLPSGVIEKFEERICGIAVPIFLGPPSVAGFDGTTFEFRYDQLFFGVHMRWWENEPPEWRSFISAIAQMTKYLTALEKQSVESLDVPA